MSKIEIRIKKSVVKKIIEDQISKGNLLLIEARKIHQESGNHDLKIRLVDNFKIEYKHWEDITIEKLKEVFLSYDYAIEFRKCKSSKDYYGSDWDSTLKFYVGDKIIPKIDYLKSIIKHIDEFVYVKNQEKSYPKNEVNKKNYDKIKDISPENIDNLTLIQLFKILGIKQIFAIIGTSVFIISGIFYFGYNVHSWKQDRDYYLKSEELKNLKKENYELKLQIDSLREKENIYSDSSSSSRLLPNKR